MQSVMVMSRRCAEPMSVLQYAWHGVHVQLEHYGFAAHTVKSVFGAMLAPELAMYVRLRLADSHSCTESNR